MTVTKTLHKKFSSFEAEEQWLDELAQSGWRLIDYGNDEFSDIHYTFQFDPLAKEMRYKIDFRPLKNATEFEDYKELFRESGWDLIAKNHRYYKYIFISEIAEDIYSDTISLIERERQKRKMISMFVFCSCIAGILAFIVKLLFFEDSDWLNVVTIMFLLIALRYSSSIYKCNKTIKRLKQVG